MPDQDKKGSRQQPPTPGAGGPGIVTSWKPNMTVRKGDVVVSDSGGWWVCMNTHTTGNTVFHLRPGQSDSDWHFSVGPS